DGWSGVFFRYRRDTMRLDFSAAPAIPPPPSPTDGSATPPNIRPSGAFKVFYQERDGIDSTTVATFRVSADSVFGTFIDPSGDHGLMAGIQSGSMVELHRFTAWQANLIEMEFREGTWQGRYYARDLSPRTFFLKPLPSLPQTPLDRRQTRMKDSRKPFMFEGITADGDTIRSTDERFRGRVVLVDIMGTWCHNCLDAAPLLQQLYEDFQKQGLEIIGLSFEITNDPAVGRLNLDIYRRRHGITFPLLYAGSLAPENVNTRLRSHLDDFFAYPTTLFIGRSGRVEKIHWGFKGPGTGEEYQQEIDAFYNGVRSMLRDSRPRNSTSLP
ncbi:MAG: TlpA disulfide reductase family protein, partial [Bacteroidota bacterium]